MNFPITTFISHPIGGDVKRNSRRVERICHNLYTYHPELLPLAPYLPALRALRDDIPEDRLRGTTYNKEFFRRNFVDELWLFGDRISRGMWEEISWARSFDVPVIPRNKNVFAELLRGELSPGDSIRMQGCGPGYPFLGKYLDLTDDELYDTPNWGVTVETPVGIIDLAWGDIIFLTPANVLHESSKRTNI